MSTYDFRSLSPQDFEELVRDLIQAEENIRLESFGPGKDKGIDLRHAEGDGNLIVQAKHYVGSGFNALLGAVRREKPKVQKLSPSRYVIATSVSMTPDRKKKLQEALDPHIVEPSDIFGAEDLNNLIGKHEKIEGQHFKLWITSTTVLKRLLNNATYARSEQEVERIRRDARLFVPNAGLSEVLRRLQDDGLLIISGQPGVGKTTLARMISLFYLDRDWDLVVVEDFEEALQVFNGAVKQIFFFDDFLGQIRLTLDVIRRVEPRLLEFIDRVKSSPNTRFALTTREYILKRAQIESEKLSDPIIDLRKYVVDLASYTRPIRANILYNHIYFSDISDEKKNVFLKKDYYLEIIDHSNFNPRLIEHLTSSAHTQNVRVRDYADWIRNTLDHPEGLWDHAFRKHLTVAAKNLIISLFFFGGSANFELLQTSFEKFHRASSDRHGHTTASDDFRHAVKETESSFIRVDPWHVDFINPSVRDYLDQALLETDALELTIQNMTCFQQAAAAWEFLQIHGEKTGVSRSSTTRVLETAAEKIRDFPSDFSSAGCRLLPRVNLLLEFWKSFHSDEIAAVAIEISEKMKTEQSDETEIGDILHNLGLVSSSEFSKFPNAQVLVENLKTHLFVKIFDEWQLPISELSTVRTFFEENPNLATDTARVLIVGQVESILANLSGELLDLTTPSDVEIFSEDLHDMADWAGINLAFVDDEIVDRQFELEMRESDKEPLAPVPTSSSPAATTTDATITSLFSTLQQN